MELDKRKCKLCEQEKTRILVGKYDAKNKRYEDETGKCWMGNKCPQCHTKDIKSRMQAMRVLRKSLVGE